MLSPVIVGEVLMEFRKRQGLSQEVVSGFAEIGRTHLSAIERGERKPTLETFYRICCAMNVKMSDVTKEIENKIEKDTEKVSEK
ncbi:MAG: helix-turn-helix transcriptional regulator [Ruminococcaceae bacterium]|nr:helix-turn-helix transcriptional regulator [Oscillospiraceae bacterium]